MPKPELPPPSPSSVISGYFEYVEQYRVASAALSESADVFWPRMQVRGLLIELALKTYICAAGEEVGRDHDLEALAERAVGHGLILTKADRTERIATVNKIYFRFIDWNAKYLARYPRRNRGLGAWVTPVHASLDEMIGRIVDQAQVKWRGRAAGH